MSARGRNFPHSSHHSMTGFFKECVAALILKDALVAILKTLANVDQHLSKLSALFFCGHIIVNKTKQNNNLI